MTRLPPIQMMWLQQWCLETSGEEPLPAARRTQGTGSRHAAL